MIRVYRGLLHLYPAKCRLEFGDEMSYVFARAQSDLRERGRVLARALFYSRELFGLVAGAFTAQVCNLFGFNHWLPFRRFDMHPGFKFPRSTVFLMCLIFAGVIVAIEKAKDITVQYGPHNVVAVGNPLPWFLLVALAAAAIIVAATWGILFALHRTGMQRLDEVQNWPEQR